MKYDFISDPGHGWLKVKRSELRILGIEGCKAWSTGDRATPAPKLEGWLCEGCRWMPEEAK